MGQLLELLYVLACVLLAVAIVCAKVAGELWKRAARARLMASIDESSFGAADRARRRRWHAFALDVAARRFTLFALHAVIATAVVIVAAKIVARIA